MAGTPQYNDAVTYNDATTYYQGSGLSGLSMPAMSVQIAFANNALDTSPTWTDVTAYCRAASIRRGRQHELNRMEAGTAQLTLDNRDGRFSPWNRSSPYWNAGTGLVPMKPIRIQATWRGVTYGVWQGYVDGWPVQWQSAADSDIRISCTDAFKIFNLALINSPGYSALFTNGPLFRFGEGAGTTTTTSTTGTTAVVANVTAGVAGAIVGDPNTAFDFGHTTAGTGGVAYFPNDSTLRLGAVGATYSFSISFWILVPALPVINVDQVYPVTQTAGPTGAGAVWDYYVYIDPSGYINFGVGQVGTSVATVATGTHNIADNKYHHVVVTCDSVSASGDMKVYLDGTLEATASNANSGLGGLSMSGQLTIGGVNKRSSMWGQLDEMYFTSDVLTPAQVQAQYQLGSAPWANDTSGARIARVLDIAGWPIASRNIATGYATLQTASSVAGNSALTHIATVVDSELGVFYMDGAGNAVFRDRYYTGTATKATTVQVTLGDGAGEEPYILDGTQPVLDDLDIWNQVSTSSQGQLTQTVNDSASQALYGVRNLSKTGLLNTTNADLLNVARLLLNRYSAAQIRVSSVRFTPWSDIENLYPQALGRDLLDRVAFKRRPFGGDALNVEALIEGISHDITPDTWTTTWSLSVTDATQKFWIIGTSAIGTDTRIG